MNKALPAGGQHCECTFLLPRILEENSVGKKPNAQLILAILCSLCIIPEIKGRGGKNGQREYLSGACDPQV